MKSTLRRHSFLGFTLLELIVVIVILGILAALAVPTFLSVIDKSRNETARTTLEAVHREAWALASFEPTGKYTLSNFTDNNVQAWGSIGVHAGKGGIVSGVEPSTAYPQVSVGIDAADPRRVGLSVRSLSGECVSLVAVSGEITHQDQGSTSRCDGTAAYVLSGAVEGEIDPATGETTGEGISVVGVTPGAPSVTGKLMGTTVTLTWNKVSSARGYTLSRQDGTGPVTTLDLGNVLTYTDTVAPGGTRTYRVTATSAAGTSAPSQAYTASVPVAPDAPVITATYQSADAAGLPQRVNLSWSHVVRATEYRLYRQVNGTGGYALLGDAVPATGANLVRTDSDLTTGNSYEYKLVAANAGGPSADSPVVAIDLALVVPTVSKATKGDRTLAYTIAPPHPDGYRGQTYKAYSAATGGTPLASSFNATTGILTVSGLENNVSYALHLSALNKYGVETVIRQVQPAAAPQKIIIVQDACATSTECTTADKMTVVLASAGYTSVTSATATNPVNPVNTKALYDAGGYSMMVMNGGVRGLNHVPLMEAVYDGGGVVLSSSNDTGLSPATFPLYTATVTVSGGSGQQWGNTYAANDRVGAFTTVNAPTNTGVSGLVAGPEQLGATMVDIGAVATGLRADTVAYATWKFRVGGTNTNPTFADRPVAVAATAPGKGRWVHIQGPLERTLQADNKTNALAPFPVGLAWVAAGR